MSPKEIDYLMKISDSLEKIAESLKKIENKRIDNSKSSLSSKKQNQIKSNALTNIKEESIFKEDLDIKEKHDKEVSIIKEESHLKKEYLDNFDQYYPILEDFLIRKGIFIDDVKQDHEYNLIIETLSNFLGNNYNDLKPFLERIKGSMNRTGSLSMSLKKYPQVQVSNICQWATLLYQNAFLVDYTYKKSPMFHIYARLNREGNVLNFFSGDWLESYVSFTIKEIIDEINFKYELDIEYHVFNNIHITLENTDKFELDIIVIINETLFFWIECKSSEYQSHIHKYSKFAKKYNFQKDRSFLVLSEIDSVISYNLTSLFGLHVISLPDFREEFYNTILEYFEISDVNNLETDILSSD